MTDIKTHAKTHSELDEKSSPYSALVCVLMLLTAGIVVKIGAAIQLAHSVHN